MAEGIFLMKKYLGLLLTGIFIFILSACGLSGIDKSVSENANSIVQEIDTSMPAPFGEEDQGDADKNFAYYSPCRHKFDEVTSNLTKLVDQNEFNKWCDAKKISDKAPTKLTDYLNLYSFIVDFNISNDVLKKVLVDERDFFKSLNWYDDSYDYHYTDDEIEILCSRDESKIMEHFRSEE
ncbi:MAG: hypothetical protein PWQ76_902, partial [Clostridiales bacterium]|nr:hypothetical protein [Clostridiales bacterium]